ncbi:GIY-YIG nuclease family protein [Pseudomonas sp. NFR16]|uniref:GIY-YIG nuclease family protein n=1 Tax=Pseudomonas sp. NFR16 TaxID=1566248 RepID=UPI0008C9BA53|nr:GIY-YIG nuclease family protein [Pseudomonas sp. NFR16]SEJ85739.1 T5orf172 domain-containing protein [Pseudomonas sp. NFR16]
MTYDGRMRELGFWAAPKEGTPEYEALASRLGEQNRDPAFKKFMKERVDKAHALKFIQTVNGAGLPQDNMIREYNEEYNNRLFNHSIHDMPSSFNTAEAFTRYLPHMSVFKLLREIDHIVSFVDYLDFVTSDDDGLKDLAGLQFMEDDVIYSFNGSHDPEELTFRCAEALVFAVSGVSLVKHGSEINVLMLAGEKCDLAEKTAEIEASFSQILESPLKPRIAPSEDLERRAVPLVEGTSLWKTIVMCRIDTVSSTIDVRYISQDCGYSFMGITDDLGTLMNSEGKFFDDRCEDMAKEMSKRMSAYQSLFEFIKVCLNLPLYVNRNEENTKVERHPTAYRDIRSQLKYKKVEKYAPISEKVATRSVIFIQPSQSEGSRNKTFYSPNIKIETSGYWKKLSLDKVGQDKVGQPIHGRTWVEKRISWVEESSKTEPLSTSSSSSSSRNHSVNPGIIYVMRCAAHGKDIFKIGLTTRTADLRSNELTSSTSAPDQFLVVEEWEVGDCELAEKIIHERLEPFRINPKREFFHARYSVIFSVIRDVIAEIDPDFEN